MKEPGVREAGNTSGSALESRRVGSGDEFRLRPLSGEPTALPVWPQPDRRQLHRNAAARRLAPARFIRRTLPASDRQAVTMPTPGPFAVFCLGPFRLNIAGVEDTGWRPRNKVRDLFQYLVNHANRPVARETLMDTLWGHGDAIAPGSSVKVAVYELRAALERLAGQTTPITLDSVGSSYILNAPDLWLDVEEFERLGARARRLDAQGRETEAAKTYAHAAAVYKGNFLADSWENWVLLRRESLIDQYVFALGRLAELALAKRQFYECLLHCQKLLAQDACREDVYRTIMLCHARMGQQGRAHSWFELCTRTMRAELDVALDPETERLHAAILRGGE